METSSNDDVAPQVGVAVEVFISQMISPIIQANDSELVIFF